MTSPNNIQNTDVECKPSSPEQPRHIGGRGAQASDECNVQFEIGRQRNIICITRRLAHERRCHQLAREKAGKIEDPKVAAVFEWLWPRAFHGPEQIINLAALVAKATEMVASGFKPPVARAEAPCAIIPITPPAIEPAAPDITPHAPRGPPDDALPDELNTLMTANGEDA